MGRSRAHSGDGDIDRRRSRSAAVSRPGRPARPEAAPPHLSPAAPASNIEALQRLVGNRAVQRIVQREDSGEEGWWDRWKKSQGITDQPGQGAGATYEQWNNALMGRTNTARANASLENTLDSASAKTQSETNAWIDAHTGDESWLRSIGHGLTAANRGVADFSTGAAAGALGMAEGMADTVAHPIDSGVGAAKMAWGSLKQTGDLAGNLVSMAGGDRTAEETGREFLEDAKETLPGKLLAPFIADIAGDSNRSINGESDTGGHWAKALGRLGGMAAVGAGAGAAGEWAAAEGGSTASAASEAAAADISPAAESVPAPDVGVPGEGASPAAESVSSPDVGAPGEGASPAAESVSSPDVGAPGEGASPAAESVPGAEADLSANGKTMNDPNMGARMAGERLDWARENIPFDPEGLPAQEAGYDAYQQATREAAEGAPTERSPGAQEPRVETNPWKKAQEIDIDPSFQNEEGGFDLERWRAAGSPPDISTQPATVAEEAPPMVESPSPPEGEPGWFEQE